MELVMSIGIGAVAGSGVWLMLRPRTFQVIIGLSMLTYAVNMFLLSMGRITVGAPPVLESGVAVNAAIFADPVPESLVLTSIVISFSMTALFLVVLLAARGLTGTDHVDGDDRQRCTNRRVQLVHPRHQSAVPVLGWRHERPALLQPR